MAGSAAYMLPRRAAAAAATAVVAAPAAAEAVVLRQGACGEKFQAFPMVLIIFDVSDIC